MKLISNNNIPCHREHWSFEPENVRSGYVLDADRAMLHQWCRKIRCRLHVGSCHASNGIHYWSFFQIVGNSSYFAEVNKSRSSDRIGWSFLASIQRRSTCISRLLLTRTCWLADVFASVLAEGLIPSCNNSLIAQNTRLDWILMDETIVTIMTSISCNTSIIDDQRNLRKILRSFWEFENREPETFILNADEQACDDHFKKTLSRDSTERFLVRLPVTNNLLLGESSDIAFKRLSQHVDLTLNPIWNSNTSTSCGKMLHHMAFARDPPASAHFYRPHHGAIKQSSSTVSLWVESFFFNYMGYNKACR